MGSPEYHREYNRLRYHKKRAVLVGMLGGQCVHCGTTKELEFDHPDPATKSFSIGDKILVFAWSKVVEEAKKCQLLCCECHKQKTAENKDGYNKRAKGERIGTSYLYAEAVLEIRQLARLGVTHQKLADKYQVTRGAISQIIRGDTWKHLPL